MAHVPPHSIVSGVEYVVDAVNGARPAADEVFAGDVTLALTYEPPTAAVHHEQQVSGAGLVCEGGIFVNEKDDHGKDLRRWRVQRKDDGRYVAVQGLY